MKKEPLSVSKIALVSYNSGTEGRVTSEWVKDKIQGFQELGFHVTLITSSISKLQSGPQLEVLKVGSLSRKDRIQEIQISNRSISMADRIALVFGRVFDLVFESLAGGVSHGSWSWTITSFPKILKTISKTKFSAIVATGGPSSAHVATVAATKLSSQKAILEFQDPFIPITAEMSPLAKKVLNLMEKWLLKNCHSFNMVTAKASDIVRQRHPIYSQKVRSFLPGSPGLIHSATKVANPAADIKNKRAIFTHLGTLYSTRNLSNFTKASESLMAQDKLGLSEILVRNVGADFSEHRDVYDKNQFEEIQSLSRVEGLSMASKSDFLLLIQHTDVRSIDTIPYKTYDYLNLQRPIFGLVQNLELRSIIEAHGGFAADPSDVVDIQNKLMEAMKLFREGRLLQSPSQINFHTQLRGLLGIRE